MKCKLKDVMKKHNNVSRYWLNKVTGWNHGRINAYYKNTLKTMTVDELEILCTIFKCKITDLIELDERTDVTASYKDFKPKKKKRDDVKIKLSIEIE